MKFFKKACLMSLCCLMATQSMAGAMNKDNAVKVSTVKVEKKKPSLKTKVVRNLSLTVGAFGLSCVASRFITEYGVDATKVGTTGFNLTRDYLKKYAKKEKVKLQGLMPYFAGVEGREFETDVVRLRSIKIRDGVTGIDEKAFYDCEGICRIFIPKSVKHISEKAFNSLFWFHPKVIYDGKKYDSIEKFLEEFRQLGGNVIGSTND